MRIKTSIKAGGVQVQHNQTVRTVKIKTGVKSGAIALNHNQTVTRGLRVRTN